VVLQDLANLVGCSGSCDWLSCSGTDEGLEAARDEKSGSWLRQASGACTSGFFRDGAVLWLFTFAYYFVPALICNVLGFGGTLGILCPRRTLHHHCPSHRASDTLQAQAISKEPAQMTDHTPFMNAAIEEARKGLAAGGIPIGSVLVIDGEIVGRGHNQRVQKGSTIRHAEMDCLEETGRLSAADYQRATLYSTLSPCDMCSGAVLLYGKC